MAVRIAGICRLIGVVLAGSVGCVGIFLAAPAASAADLGSVRQPPPGEPLPFLPEPLSPTLILGPLDGSAEAQVGIIGTELASCLAAHGVIDVSRDGGASVLAAGDGSLFWGGMGPIAILHLDEELTFLANLEIAGSGPPGGDQAVARCVEAAGDTGAPDLPLIPPPAAVVPGRHPVDVTSPSPVPPAADTALAAPDSLDSGRPLEKLENQSPPPGVGVPTGDVAGSAAAAVSTRPGADPESWGTLIGALLLVGAVLAVPSLIPFVLQARRGPKWVRANVRAQAGVAPAAGTALTPPLEDWLPTSVVRFALRADGGAQNLTET